MKAWDHASAVLLACLAVGTSAAHAAGDSARGAAAFQQCASCHSVEPGTHLTGPSLAHVWGRRAAAAPGFARYSDALLRSGLVWNDQTLERWLVNPQALVPGTSMTFPGVRNPQVREDLIAFLRAVSQGKAPAAGAPMGGGMMGSPEPADLKRAGADAQVRAIQHCKDTYIVKTADGKVHKVWEFNVRLKTDSSKRGPAPGKPVVAGSGMRGDRISIVFASPKDLSQIIQESCE
jgi:cytochrome c